MNKPTFFFIIAVVAGLLLAAWLKMIKPSTDAKERERIVKAALAESITNGEKFRQEVKRMTDENDRFLGCTVKINRKALREFHAATKAKFSFTEEKEQEYYGIQRLLEAMGVFSDGPDEIEKVFYNCGLTRELYEKLQSFFAQSSNHGYNFNF